jgi:protein-tyrosine phosphatase
MAEALLRARLRDVGVDATVTSAGELPGGAPASGGSVRMMAARGLDLAGHISRTVSVAELRRADLVLAMARRHLRFAVGLAPEVFSRTFTVKELARRGTEVGPRRRGQSLQDWLAAVHHGRRTAELLGDSRTDDVADPIGKPDPEYAVTALELESLLDTVVALAFSNAEQRETA